MQHQEKLRASGLNIVCVSSFEASELEVGEWRDRRNIRKTMMEGAVEHLEQFVAATAATIGVCLQVFVNGSYEKRERGERDELFV